MSKRLIALDDGHGMGTAGKRTPTLPNGERSETGNFMHENEFNRAVVKYLNTELQSNGFGTLLVAPTDVDTSLSVRTTLANSWNADLYISVHANASTAVWGNWGGIETYSHPSGESKRLANIVHKHVMQGTKFKDRGVKDGSHLWVIRKTRMPSILLELGFMDGKEDYKYLLSDAYRRECATEIAKGVCEYYGVQYKEAVKQASKPSTTAKEPTATKDSKTHTIKKGDTFYSIAKEYGLTVSKLEKYNPKVKADNLQIGDVISLVEAKKESTKKLTYKKVLKKNSKGADVKALQEALTELKFKMGDIDGIYGEKTVDAVERFQKVYLPKEVDGQAGKNTISKINELLK